VLPWGARKAGAARLVGIIPSATGAGDTASGASGLILGVPPIGPDGGIPPESGDGNPPIGPDGMPGIGPPSAGPPPSGPGIGIGIGIEPGRGPPNAGDPVLAGWSGLPQLRQNFIPGGFSPRHTPHTEMPGNPCAGGGVCAKACAPDEPTDPTDRELPQFRQNDDPAGLSWPHFEQRIGPLSVPLTLNSIHVSQQPQVSGMGAGRFATP
jgi:hypothetical protein